MVLLSVCLLFKSRIDAGGQLEGGPFEDAGVTDSGERFSRYHSTCRQMRVSYGIEYRFLRKFAESRVKIFDCSAI